MKVILNKDLSTLGEEGDVKDVAKGYARNFLFPRGIALPYNDRTVKLFEGRKEEIDGRKAEKRKDAASLKERLENVELTITMPAGANGRLYGAVTTQTVMDELAKQGFQVERKRIEFMGSNFKTVGKYKALIKLYESAAAEIGITVVGQEIKTESTPVLARPRRGRREEPREETVSQPAENVPPAEAQSAQVPVESAPAEEVQT
ncbi:MAG: 50S ribosomal protein L9 [Treponema sp.]|jgi:large subunit ribosomal protein L9|nr:50S ribosomal protein L9 [Treponema sp.]